MDPNDVDVLLGRNLGMLAKETFAEARQLGWFDTHDSKDVEQLLCFCRSLPLVGF